MTRLLLIRHGETWANRKEVFAGYTDAKLTDNGYLQAEKTADFIKDRYFVDRVYSSDLQRAFYTGKAVAERFGLEVISEKDMREINGGVWEDVPYATLCDRYPEEYGVWLQNIGKCQCIDGESVEELGQRVMRVLTKIAQENIDKTVVVTTHATPIRVAQCLMEYGDLNKMKNIPWVSNASVTEIEYHNGEWKCIVASQDEHLGEIRTELPDTV